MKTDFKHCYQLEQQTPMIHFQSEETGATLRATDVKPKLDKFILLQLGEGNYTDGITKAKEKKWLIGEGQHPALQYKLRFLRSDNVEKDSPHKLYLGNIDGKNQKDSNDKSKKDIKTIFHKDNITMTIICFTSELQAYIETILPYFFVIHAFGARTSKGFGCFALKNTPIDSELLKSYCPLQTYYSISSIPPNNRKTKYNYFDTIWGLSGMMKGGFNFTSNNPKSYFKGHIFRYSTLKGVGGDKAFIKHQSLLNYKDQNKDSEFNQTYKKFKFVRAMLGLPLNYRFKKHKDDKDFVSIQVMLGKGIERFQAPVYFRVQKNQILMIPQIIPKKMNNAEFQFKSNKVSDPIKTPSDFDLIDFLDSFCERVHSELADSQSNNFCKYLLSISQLKIVKH